MQTYLPRSTKIGILGGGQLGKMLVQEAARFDMDLSFLDPSDACPVSKISNSFVCGDFNHYEDVLNFGRQMDVVSVEIEHVNVEALRRLEIEGVHVYPQPNVLSLIQDKGLQKQFYREHGLPTAPFDLFDDMESLRFAIESNAVAFPFVAKLRTGGYDGRGVFILSRPEQLGQVPDVPIVAESLAGIDKEIAVIVARDRHGNTKAYSPVSMEFHPEANLVEDIVCPAEIPANAAESATRIALKAAECLGVTGLLAVEMFFNKDGSLWINEMAPRPHNSGHLTLNNGAASQFENHLRILCDLPLGSGTWKLNSMMVNLLGEPGHEGPAVYQGLDEILTLPGVHLYLYGKDQTRSHRKMGHVNITGDSLESCRQTARTIRKKVKITT
ncbi:MAG: 5-(carboxyamino)imidazole ribonucleotide synthase [Saprospiraceae bacterium]|jgi:5-(carboxyamino)imidazole ribonucleotide synthase|nr:5-(carboxyamino)imidazole ribonucleotide synthase [Saprospiraceae bacterium]MBP9210845.1 5-(carboxyamino)imidazole ribonucleotide synthase [Saprospiraceae bacterium]MBV6471780.1 N5-carboxyaminoimidazole ribonucleotide synthase [Saprospiraceae bacterium]